MSVLSFLVDVLTFGKSGKKRMRKVEPEPFITGYVAPKRTKSLTPRQLRMRRRHEVAQVTRTSQRRMA